ncbi:hypothetical protein MGSAQ_002627 [marine sediment metagenome]|uniref:Uncharacterized protein n=1 Tax=marine sediment metagenome TaxID=412755 RepID=A0A1B6NSI0_9ZZZZ
MRIVTHVDAVFDGQTLIKGIHCHKRSNEVSVFCIGLILTDIMT